MHQLIQQWLKRYFAEAELAILWLFLGFIILGFGLFGKLLAPVLVAIVIAYLLQWPIAFLQGFRLPRVMAMLTTYIGFLSIMVLSLIGLIPLLWQQLSHLVAEFPAMTAQGQALLLRLPNHYPNYISSDQIQALITECKLALTHLGQWILSTSVASIPSLIAMAIYLVLVPVLVYFFLMDQEKILAWIKRYLPKQRRLISEVWHEVYAQTGNYVRGKTLEMLLVWLVSYLAFVSTGLEYAMLLSLLVGVSVIIPYVGVAIVTIPIVIIALLQWGLDSRFAYLLVIYALISLLDAYLLVPVLFSEAVDLHPVALIIAILISGGLLGFWGIFFAIPLASLVKAILNVLQTSKKPSTIT